jgi:hypothetical protein
MSIRNRNLECCGWRFRKKYSSYLLSREKGRIKRAFRIFLEIEESGGGERGGGGEKGEGELVRRTNIPGGQKHR